MKKIIISIVFGSMVGLIVGLLIMVLITQLNEHITTESNIENISDCNLRTIEQSARCSVNYVSDFYFYNESNVRKELDFQTLKEEGGVCSNWAHLYSGIGKDFGYYTKNIIIKMNKTASHEISIWSNGTRYCIVDQIQALCN